MPKGQYPSINVSDIQNTPVPLPPLSVQQSIISECEAVDNEVETAKAKIDDLKERIDESIDSVRGNLQYIKTICSVISPSKTYLYGIDKDTIVSFIEMASVSNDGYIEMKEDKPLKDVKSGSYKYFAEGDIIVAKITPCMENGKCAIANGLTNGIGMGSSEFHVFRINETIIDNCFLFAVINRDKIRKQAASVMTGASGYRRVPISFYEELQIPVPSLSEQQVVSEISGYVAHISAAKETINNSAKRKQEILDKYLK